MARVNGGGAGVVQYSHIEEVDFADLKKYFDGGGWLLGKTIITQLGDHCHKWHLFFGRRSDSIGLYLNWDGCEHRSEMEAIELRSVAFFAYDQRTDTAVALARDDDAQTLRRYDGTTHLQCFDSLRAIAEGGFLSHGDNCVRVKVVWEVVDPDATLPKGECSLLERMFVRATSMATAGGDACYELVSSDGERFSVSIAVLESRSPFFGRFFTADGWREQDEQKMNVDASGAVVKELLRYLYLNEVDDDICQHLPDILEAAQMWQLDGLTGELEQRMAAQIRQTAACSDGGEVDTDLTVDYLHLADLHRLPALAAVCLGVLADNFERFYASKRRVEMEALDRQLVPNIVRHKCHSMLVQH